VNDPLILRAEQLRDGDRVVLDGATFDVAWVTVGARVYIERIDGSMTILERGHVVAATRYTEGDG
jgi:hypothetical protein